MSDERLRQMGVTLGKEETALVSNLAIALSLQNAFQEVDLKKSVMQSLLTDEEAYARILKFAIHHFKGLFNSLIFIHEEGDKDFLERMTADLIRAIGTKIQPN